MREGKESAGAFNYYTAQAMCLQMSLSKTYLNDVDKSFLEALQYWPMKVARTYTLIFLPRHKRARETSQ